MIDAIAEADVVLEFLRELNRSIDRGETLKNIEKEIGYSITEHAGYDACLRYLPDYSRFIIAFNLSVPWEKDDYASMTLEKAMELYELDTKGKNNG